MLKTLPSELISKIASYLSYQDLYALRQALARKDFDNAINKRTIWLNLSAQYLTENSCSHFSKLRSLPSLNTSQLRQRFEKRFLTNCVWPLSREIHPSVKRLAYPDLPMLTIKIAPGGRWAFGGTRKCTVYYWDLDSEHPEPFVLEPVDDVDNIPGNRTPSIVQINFVVEHEDPLSGFVLAFIGCDLDNDHHGKSDEWLYIWDVTPRENGTPEAKHLKSLPLPYDGMNSILSFNEYMAASHHPLLSFNEHMAARYIESRLDVYWWKDCMERHLVRCTMLFPPKEDYNMTNIYVFGSDKLLVYTREPDRYKIRLCVLGSANSPLSKYRTPMGQGT